MGKRFAKILAAVALTTVVGGAITNKVFSDVTNSSLLKLDSLFNTVYAGYAGDTISCNDTLENIANAPIAYNLPLNFNSKIIGHTDTNQINIWIPNKLNLESVSNTSTDIDMSAATQSLRRLKKEKFYFKHRDQFDKDSLALIDIVNSIDLYSEIVSRELIIAMINEESSFFMFPESSWAGARGPMQVRKVGWETVETDSYLLNVDIPRRNILAGVKIARWLETYCEKNYKNWSRSSLQRKRDLIVAAYDCGIGTLIAYDDFQRAKKDSSFVVERHPWYIDETPLETRDYVAKVAKSLKYVLNKEISQKKLLAYNKP
jgi:hypothetical protein